MPIEELILEYVKTLVWSVVATLAVLLFRAEISKALGRLHQAKLPGGVSLEFENKVAEAKKISEKVQTLPAPADRPKKPEVPITEANARLISLGLQPSPSGLDLSHYEALAESDPNLALAGIRIELELFGRNLGKGFSISGLDHVPIGNLLRTLVSQGAIDSTQGDLANRVLELCNQAVHGYPASYSDALTVINLVRVLADDYLAWLGWGFDDEWHPSGKPGAV